MLAEKFGDLANYAVAGLVFGQALGERPFSVGAGLAAVTIWLLFTGGMLLLARGNE